MGSEITAAMIEEFREMDTCCISDAMDRLGIPCGLEGIKPVNPDSAMCGPAFTVHYVPCGTVKGTVGDFLDDVKPGQVVVIDNINCELAPADIYSGMYARVTVRFFGYANSGNKGVGCGLGNIMKTRDGEALAGGASASVDFAGVGAAPAAMPVPPVAYNAPAVPVCQPPAYGVAPVAPAPVWGAAGGIDPITGRPM